MTSVSGPSPIASLGLSTQGQAQLKKLDQDGNGTLTRSEIDLAIKEAHASPDNKKAGLTTGLDNNVALITKPELTMLGFSESDSEAILKAIPSHAIDPTSPLVQFGEPAPVVASTEPVRTEVAPTEPAPPATATKPLESQADLPALTTKPGMVLRGAPLNARLKELEGQSQKGIERLETRIKELGDKAPAELKASLEKLKELKALLANSDPKAVEKLQTFLTTNNGTRSGDQAFNKRLEYQSNGQTKTFDNLYGKRTDACLRDLIMELGNQDVPAAAPVVDTPAHADATAVSGNNAPVRRDNAATVPALNQPLLTGAWNLGGFGVPTSATRFNAGSFATPDLNQPLLTNGSSSVLLSGSPASRLTDPLATTTSMNINFNQPVSLYSPSSAGSLSFGPRINPLATSSFGLTDPTLSFGQTNTSFNSARFGLTPDFGYRPTTPLSFTDYSSPDFLTRFNTGTFK